MNYEQRHEGYQAICKRALEDAARDCLSPERGRVSEAARYALMNGGKRVRGVLALAAAEMLGGRADSAALFAAAIEIIHAFSLTHDDMPCMDDDDLRRGQPAVHIAYGEATALLAGDMLAITPFALLAEANLPPSVAARAASLLAGATADMIYGQELDLKYEAETPDKEALLDVHSYKTGALIDAALQLGAMAVNAAPADCARLNAYGLNIGLAFQIVDDVLDATGTRGELGKPAGRDAARGKTTFATLMGPEKARAEALRLTAEAAQGLEDAYGEKADFLSAYAHMLAQRLK